MLNEITEKQKSQGQFRLVIENLQESVIILS